MKVTYGKATYYINVGDSYTNFRGYTRTILEIYEGGDGHTHVKYQDGTGPDRACRLETFIYWLKRNCY